MVSQNQPTRTTSTMRKAVERVLGRGEEPTTIEECRRCGKTIEPPEMSCSACGCSDIVEYRIR